MSGRKRRFSHLRSRRHGGLLDDVTGTLRVSWSRDGGMTWRMDDRGAALALANRYGYPGGCVLEDESILTVYYDACGDQTRTEIWAMRFWISGDRTRVERWPAPVDVAWSPTMPPAASSGHDEIDADAMV